MVIADALTPTSRIPASSAQLTAPRQLLAWRVHRLCVRYDDDSVKGHQVEFLFEDASIQCGTNEHVFLKSISIFLILLW